MASKRSRNENRSEKQQPARKRGKPNTQASSEEDSSSSDELSRPQQGSIRVRPLSELMDPRYNSGDGGSSGSSEPEHELESDSESNSDERLCDARLLSYFNIYAKENMFEISREDIKPVIYF